MPEGKELRYKTSRIYYFWNYFITILLFILLFLLLPYLDFNALWSNLTLLFIFLVIVILVLEPEGERILREYFITNSEVTKVEGIIVKKRISIPYQSVADVRVVKGVIGRIFNFGTINVKGMKEDIIMKGIKEPETVGKIIEHKIFLVKSPRRAEKREKE